MNALVLAVHDDNGLDSNTARLVTAARGLVDEVDVLVIGNNCAAAAQQAAGIAGVKRVLLAQSAAFDGLVAETVAAQLLALAGQYQYVVGHHGMVARAAFPRAAALAGAAYLADVVAVERDGTFTRPMYAGSVIAKVASRRERTFFTVRSAAYEAATAAPAAAPVVDTECVAPYAKTRLAGRERVTDARPDLTRAGVVVGVGRGIGSADKMPIAEALADKIGAALGASRAAVDAGFASNAIQIGQTGKTVAPKVYMAFGISGAIQHLAGIKDAKVIVAVNKDAEAPIFSVADYGLVGDLFDVIPALTNALGAPAA